MFPQLFGSPPANLEYTLKLPESAIHCQPNLKLLFVFNHLEYHRGVYLLIAPINILRYPEIRLTSSYSFLFIIVVKLPPLLFASF